MISNCRLLSTSCSEVPAMLLYYSVSLCISVAMSKQFTEVFLHVSSRRCPGIFSYHIACHAVRHVMSQPLDGLWAQEDEEGQEEGGGKSGGAGAAKQKCMSGSACV